MSSRDCDGKDSSSSSSSSGSVSSSSSGKPHHDQSQDEQQSRKRRSSSSSSSSSSGSSSSSSSSSTSTSSDSGSSSSENSTSPPLPPATSHTSRGRHKGTRTQKDDQGGQHSHRRVSLESKGQSDETEKLHQRSPGSTCDAAFVQLGKVINDKTPDGSPKRQEHLLLEDGQQSISEVFMKDVPSGKSEDPQDMSVDQDVQSSLVDLTKQPLVQKDENITPVVEMVDPSEADANASASTVEMAHELNSVERSQRPPVLTVGQQTSLQNEASEDSDGSYESEGSAASSGVAVQKMKSSIVQVVHHPSSAHCSNSDSAQPRSHSRSPNRRRERQQSRSPLESRERDGRSARDNFDRTAQERARNWGRDRDEHHKHAPTTTTAKQGEVSVVEEEPPAKKKKTEGEELLMRSGGAYIPPAKLRMLQQQITDKSSVLYQRMSWEALKKSIIGIVNKVNVSNIKDITRDLFRENLVRGRGLLARSIIQAQVASPTFTHVYASFVSLINSKFPQNGELILKRLILNFRKGYRRNDKTLCLTTAKFIAHLVNHDMAHEVLALEILTLLLEQPTDDSVEVAVGFLKECGLKLSDVSPRGLNAIYERLRNILHESAIDKRVQYMIEVVFAVRKDGFKDHPIIFSGLNKVKQKEKITHMLTLEDDYNPEDLMNIFKEEANFLQNEDRYLAIKEHLLKNFKLKPGDDYEDEDDDDDADNADDDDDDDDDDEDTDDDDDDEVDESEDKEQKKMTIIDETETNEVAFRRTIYLIIQSSLDFEECAHKLLKMEFPPGKEKDLCNMILDCCAQQRTYEKFYGLLAGRFALLKKEYMEAFEAIFCDQYETIHRLETNKLRNVAKMFAHLLYTDAIPWTVLENVVLSEEMTTSSSRIFVKVLFQELCEYMGLPRLNERLKDVTLQPFFEGLFPRDNPRNTRFAINFFTSIGLGGLTDELREYRKNAPQLIMAQRQCIESEKDDDSSSDSSSSSSSSDSSDSSSSSSSSDSSSSDSESSSESSSTDSSDSNSDQLHKKKDKKKLREIGHKERTGGKDVQEPRRDEDCSGRRSSRTNQDSSKHEMDESHGNPYCVNGTHRRGRGSAERSTCIDSEAHSSRRDKIRHTGDRLQHNDQDTRAKKPHCNEEGRDEDKGRNYYGGVREREREKHGNYHQDKFQRVRRQDFRDRSELERKGTSYRQEQDNNEGNGERNMEYRSRHENADRHRNRKQNARKMGEEYDTDEELKGMQIDREVRKDKDYSSDSCSEDDTRKKHRSQRTMDKNEDTLRDQKRQRDVEGKKCNDFDKRQKQKHRKRDDLVGNEESGTESEGRNKRRHRSGDREKSWQRETQKKKIDRERQHQVHSEDENRTPAKNKRYSMEKEGQSNVGRFREDKDVRKGSDRERDRREHSRKDKRDRPENDGGLRRDSRGRRERDDERKDTDHHDRRQSLEQSKLRCRDGSHEQDGDRRRPKERSTGQKHHRDRSRDRDDGSESPRRR